MRPSAFGKALGGGNLQHTSEEVACLIRSGARAESSLTTDAASFLRRRFQHIKSVTQLSESEDSEDEEWDCINNTN